MSDLFYLCRNSQTGGWMGPRGTLNVVGKGLAPTGNRSPIVQSL
jgi:hypothetical protein